MTPTQLEEIEFYAEDVPKKRQIAHDLFLKYSQAQMEADRAAREYSDLFNLIIKTL